MKLPKAILFDLDGTLLDSIFCAYDGVKNVFNNLGRSSPTMEEYFLHYRPPFIQFYRDRGVVIDDAEINRLYHEVAKHEEAALFEDVLETLNVLKGRGIIMGIISCQHQERLDLICGKHNIHSVFHAVTGSAISKTAQISSFCVEYHLGVKDVWFVGDWQTDMIDAKKVGVVAIGITRNQNTEAMLVNAGADYCINDLDELTALLG